MNECIRALGELNDVFRDELICFDDGAARSQYLGDLEAAIEVPYYPA